MRPYLSVDRIFYLQILLGLICLTSFFVVVSAQTGTVPLATMSVVLPGGTATDPADKAGLSELAAVIAKYL